MNTWEHIDALKAKFDAEFRKVKSQIVEQVNQSSADSLHINAAGLWQCDVRKGPLSQRITSRTGEGLLAQLPKAK